MSSAPSRRPVLAAVFTPLLVVLGLVAATGSAAASTVPDDSGPADSGPVDSGPAGGVSGDADVVVLDEGKGDERFDLQPEMIVGTIAHAVETSTAAGTLVLTGTQALDETIGAVTTVEQTAEVIAVQPDGGYTLRRTVDSYDFTVTEGTPDVADGFKEDEELEGLVGVPLEQTYDRDGRVLTIVPADGAEVTAEQQESIETLIADGRDRPPFPDVDVGVGAVWTAELPGANAAGGSARYEVISIDGNLATIEVAFEGDSSTLQTLLSPAFDEISGEFGGQGVLVADIENQLASTFDFALRMDVTMTGEPGELTLGVDLSNSRVVTVE